MDQFLISQITDDEIIDTLNRLYDESQPVIPSIGQITVRAFAHSGNHMIRSALAVALCNDEACDVVSAILRSLCRDQVEMVRIQAAVSLGCFPSVENAECLLSLVDDPSVLTSSYAVLSLSNMGSILGDRLQTYLTELTGHPSEFVAITACYALTKLGELNYLQVLMDRMDSSNHRVRALVLDGILDLLNHQDHAMVENYARKLRAESSCEPAKSRNRDLNALLSVYIPVTMADLPGKVLLIGLTYENEAQEMIEQKQYWGVISAASERSVTITQANGQTFTVQPTIQEIGRARPGEYTLASTGEIVTDPDFLFRTTITIPSDHAA